MVTVIQRPSTGIGLTADQLADLRDRYVRDIANLRNLAALKGLPASDYDAAETGRLRGKAEGVALALSKLDETIRLAATQ